MKQRRLAKLRHAAALALIGWYLLSPPVNKAGTDIVWDAPMRAWVNLGAFDTEAACNGKKRDDVAKAATIAKHYAKLLPAGQAQVDANFAQAEGVSLPMAHYLATSGHYWLEAEQCVPDNDQRLPVS